MGRVNGEDSRVSWPWTLAAHNGNALTAEIPTQTTAFSDSRRFFWTSRVLVC